MTIWITKFTSKLLKKYLLLVNRHFCHHEFCFRAPVNIPRSFPQGLQNFAKLCKVLQNFAKLCKTLQNFAKVIMASASDILASPSFNPLLLSRSTRKHPQIVPPGAPLGAPLGVPQGVPLGYPQNCKILQFFPIFQHFFNIFQYPIVKSYNLGGIP